MSGCTCESYSVDDYGDCPDCLIKKDNERMIAEARTRAAIRYCSFCGKSEYAVEFLVVAWEGKSPGICNECIDLCNEISAVRQAVPTTESKDAKP